MNTKLDFERNASLGFFRNIAILIGFMLLGFAIFAMCGCATIRSIVTDESIQELAIEQLDRLADKWIAKAKDLPEFSGNSGELPPTVNDSLTVDAIPFASLQWRYGGFNGSGAVFDRVTLANLTCDGHNVRYTFVGADAKTKTGGLDVWGLKWDEAGAICAVFIERPNGTWEGGKFDWVSTSRASRGLKHLTGYNGWNESLPVRGRVAFVIFSADGKRRSNVVISDAK